MLSMDALDILPRLNIPNDDVWLQLSRAYAQVVTASSHIRYQWQYRHVQVIVSVTFDVKATPRRTERRRPFPAWLVALSSGWWADGWFPISLGRRCFQDEQYRTRQVSKCNGRWQFHVFSDAPYAMSPTSNGIRTQVTQVRSSRRALIPPCRMRGREIDEVSLRTYADASSKFDGDTGSTMRLYFVEL